ncbi:MAG TPA: hypothetical protein PKM63_08355 [Panacibacter sp.]|nr:hypothetical protein [Panacibacter sp.]HNP44278.1 hypothetical protein [Panacibacter sp.]
MNKTWSVIEKVLGVLIAVWGCFVLYSMVHMFAEMSGSGFLATGKVTYSSMIRGNHLSTIVSLIAVFGGTMLLFNDKNGWMLSIISTATFALLLFISSRANSTNGTLPYAANFKGYGLLSIICFIILAALILKPFRTKYKPTVKNWMWITVTIAVMMIDKFFV